MLHAAIAAAVDAAAVGNLLKLIDDLHQLCCLTMLMTIHLTSLEMV